MRTTVVPAQITTVEDRIAGNLTFSQVVLLIVPLVTGLLTYVEVSPHSKLSVLKTVLVGVQFLAFGSLAIRVRGRIVAEWLAILLRFSARPRIYLATVQEAASDDYLGAATAARATEQIPVKSERPALRRLDLVQQMHANNLFTNPGRGVRFVPTKKGGIDVTLSPL